MNGYIGNVADACLLLWQKKLIAFCEIFLVVHPLSLLGTLNEGPRMHGK